MNANFFVSDPDAFCVSTQVVTDQPWHGGKVPLSLDEAKASIALSAVAGGMHEIGDDLPALGAEPERLALVENRDLIEMIKLGRASKPLDLLSYLPEDGQPSIFWLAENDRQGMLTVFNWTDKIRSHSIDFSTLGFAASNQLKISDVFDGKEVATANPDSCIVDLPARSARMFKIENMSIVAKPPAIKLEEIPPMKTGVAVAFRAHPESSHGAVVSYRWSFGDGVSLEGPEVSHAYTQPGSYEVVATAIGLSGLSTETKFHVQVSGSVSTRFVPSEKRRYQPSK
jgi:hypothetical protein